MLLELLADQSSRSGEAVCTSARQHVAEIEPKIADLGALRHELAARREGALRTGSSSHSPNSCRPSSIS
ncbi:MAG: hypothetical protein EOQ28_09990 [Mesorhizobium sp.]|uniref:hypothetical protein n=1 Tax=Mesorhizobium sp. TaxID=1871066 RepID=UPI000FE8B7F3|nr:hypothetical protein [Mesorhizobium sp.]RWA75411.1 MAG: hypothetical protein EOQ28_09990 [Mesorhizobium sp.]